MKRFSQSILGFIGAMLLVPNITLAATPQSLINAINETLTADYKAQAQIGVNYGESALTANNTYWHSEDRFKENAVMEGRINVPDFDPTAPQMMIDFSAETEYTADLEAKKHFLAVKKLVLEFTGDKLLKEAVEGMFELLKLTVNKTYELDTAEIVLRIKESVTSESNKQEMEDFFSPANSLNNWYADLEKVVTIILDSGVFKITQSGTNYTITLADTPEIKDYKDLLKQMAELSFISADRKEEIWRDIGEITSKEIESIRKKSRTTLKELKKALDFSLLFTIGDGRIASLDLDVKYTPTVNSDETNLVYPLGITSHADFRYETVTIALPSITADTISVTNFIKGIIALNDYGTKQYGLINGNDDGDYPDYQIYRNRAVIDASDGNNGNKPWYADYIDSVEGKLNLSRRLSPANIVRTDFLFEVISAAVRNDSDDALTIKAAVCSMNDREFEENAGVVLGRMGLISENYECISVVPYTLIRRGEGIDYIVGAIFPEISDRQGFAVANGFISETYLNNPRKFMNEAELAKIISKILEYHANQ